MVTLNIFSALLLSAKKSDLEIGKSREELVTFALMLLPAAAIQTMYSSITYKPVDEFMFLELERSVQNSSVSLAMQQQRQPSVAPLHLTP